MPNDRACVASTDAAPPEGVVRRRLFVTAVLVIVLGVGAVVRWTGIRHGEPDLVFHPDVAKQTFVARRVLQGTLDLQGLYGANYELSMYPYGTAVLLGTVLHAAGVDPEAAAEAGPPGRWRWALWMRWLASGLFLGAAAIVLAAESRRVAPGALLSAGLLLVLEPLNAEYSHYGMNDVPLAAMLLLVWLGASRMSRDRAGLPWRAVLTGAALGIGFGIKYQAVLGFLFPLCAWILRGPRNGVKWWLGTSGAVLSGFLAGAFFTCPGLRDLGFAASEFPKFLAWQANVTGLEIPFGERLAGNVRILTGLALDNGSWVLLPTLFWALWQGLRHHGPPESRELLLSGAVFPVVLIGIFLASRDFVRSNDLVAATPFPAVLTGHLLAGWRRDPKAGAVRSVGATATWAFVLVGVFLFARTSVLDARALARPDTRFRARDWCQTHLPANASVLQERYTLPIGVPRIDETRTRFVGTGDAWQAVQEGRFSHVVTSSLAHERFVDPLSVRHDERIRDRYEERLPELFHRVVRFRDRKLFFAHPTIDVWERRGPAPGSGPEVQEEEQHQRRRE